MVAKDSLQDHPDVEWVREVEVNAGVSWVSVVEAECQEIILAHNRVRYTCQSGFSSIPNLYQNILYKDLHPTS